MEDKVQFDWQQKGWPKATVNRAALRDELRAFGVAFKELKAALGKPQDMELVVRAMTDEAVKWMRMAKVSKPTATRDLEELEASGAIVAKRGAGPVSGYRLDCPLCEPIDPLNDPLNASLEEHLAKVVARHPGVQMPFLASVESSLSKVTVKRAIAALVKAGRIEHRGSKKTGGYYMREE